MTNTIHSLRRSTRPATWARCAGLPLAQGPRRMLISTVIVRAAGRRSIWALLAWGADVVGKDPQMELWPGAGASEGAGTLTDEAPGIDTARLKAAFGSFATGMT